MLTFKQGRWNLSELADNPNSPSFKKRLHQIESKVKDFEKNRRALSPSISEGRFLSILHALEEISEKFSTISGYASLQYSADTQSDEATSLLTRMRKLGSEIENRTLFFDQWWKKQIDEKNAKRLMQHVGDLQEYLRFKRLVARYSLSEPEEKIINTLDVTGHSALVKLYDKITNAFQFSFKIDGKTRIYTREELTRFVRSPKAKLREMAYKSLLGQYDTQKGVLGEIYQNIVLNWKDECIQMRGYTSPISVRNIGNDVDDKTVEVLLAICRKNSYLFCKFFLLKARLLNVKKLRRYDIYAPIEKKEERRYPYDKGVKLVLHTLCSFSPKLGELAKKVLIENHVDSSTRAGKRSGAFCSTIAPAITPYVLVNFKGRSNDVFTLAHELGHAIHSMAASDKSIFVQEAPLPLAEMASTFSEMLLFDQILNQISDKERQSILVEHMDDLYSTIGRQTYFTIFETMAHQKIGEGATVQEISAEYMKTLKEQFGTALSLSADFSVEWACIPHFYHSPFYCYSYSFGNLLALSLFQQYRKEGKSFVPVYVDILSAGGTRKPEALLKDHGIDISSGNFWQQGFEYIKDQIQNLERLID